MPQVSAARSAGDQGSRHSISAAPPHGVAQLEESVLPCTKSFCRIVGSRQGPCGCYSSEQQDASARKEWVGQIAERMVGICSNICPSLPLQRCAGSLPHRWHRLKMPSCVCIGPKTVRHPAILGVSTSGLRLIRRRCRLRVELRVAALSTRNTRVDGSAAYSSRARLQWSLGLVTCLSCLGGLLGLQPPQSVLVCSHNTTLPHRPLRRNLPLI